MAQRIVSFLLAVALFVCIFGTQSAQAWGKEGHMAVADIAYSRLTVAAQQAVDYYLGGQLSLPDAAPYPDDYDHSAQGRWSATLHYANLPRDAVQYSAQYCPTPPNCVVGAIFNYTKLQTLQGTTGPVCTFQSGDEPCPLVYLTHLMGDIHQPLHVGYGDDEGGNKVSVTFFGKSGNLHQVWDEFIVQRFVPNWQTLSADLQDTIKSQPGVVARYMSVTDPTAWANESFQLVRTTVYNFTDSSRISTQAIQLGEDYYQVNLPIVQQRVIAAGVRLAQLLNTIFNSTTGEPNWARMHTVMASLQKLKGSMNPLRE